MLKSGQELQAIKDAAKLHLESLLSCEFYIKGTNYTGLAPRPGDKLTYELCFVLGEYQEYANKQPTEKMESAIRDLIDVAKNAVPFSMAGFPRSRIQGRSGSFNEFSIANLVAGADEKNPVAARNAFIEKLNQIYGEGTFKAPAQEPPHWVEPDPVPGLLDQGLQLIGDGFNSVNNLMRRYF